MNETACSRRHSLRVAPIRLLCVAEASAHHSASIMRWYGQLDGVWVYDRRQIARRYLLGWFWIDFPSAVPVESARVSATFAERGPLWSGRLGSGVRGARVAAAGILGQL